LDLASLLVSGRDYFADLRGGPLRSKREHRPRMRCWRRRSLWQRRGVSRREEAEEPSRIWGRESRQCHAEARGGHDGLCAGHSERDERSRSLALRCKRSADMSSHPAKGLFPECLRRSSRLTIVCRGTKITRPLPPPIHPPHPRVHIPPAFLAPRRTRNLLLDELGRIESALT